jgi:hypothetical protein
MALWSRFPFKLLKIWLSISSKDIDWKHETRKCYGHGSAGDRQRRVEVYLLRLLIACWKLGERLDLILLHCLIIWTHRLPLYRGMAWPSSNKLTLSHVLFTSYSTVGLDITGPTPVTVQVSEVCKDGHGAGWPVGSSTRPVKNAPNGPLVCSIKQVRIVGSAPIESLGQEVQSIHDFFPAEALPASASSRIGLRPRQLQLAGWGRASVAHMLTARLGAATVSKHTCGCDWVRRRTANRSASMAGSSGVRQRSSSPGEHPC